MIVNQKLKYLFLCFLWLGSRHLQAQDISIQLGNKNIALNETFTITLSITNDEIKTHSPFPDIQGFVKAGVSSNTSTVIINGDMSSTHSVTQSYIPQKEGKFRLKPFSMQVNDQTLRSQGDVIIVSAPREQSSSNDPFAYDPFEDIFPRLPQAALNQKDDAFLSVSSNKKDVFVGEGFNVVVSFIVAENNATNLQFYKLGEQLAEIVKKIKPKDCWEENFGIENIEGVPININGKRYTEYRMYQATYYPLNTEPIRFPSVALKMVKYNLVGGGLFGQTQEEFKAFASQPISVKVKELPPHPLRNSVPVGNYRLDETLSKTAVQTGQSITYEFKVRGEGNISSLNAPEMQTSAAMDIYPPNVRQDIERNYGRVIGNKNFIYSVLPKEAGMFKLSDVFGLVFFNPTTARYDTLRPNATFTVTGASKHDMDVQQIETDGFYNRILEVSNTLRSTDREEQLKVWANVVLLAMLSLTIFFIFKKNKQV